MIVVDASAMLAALLSEESSRAVTAELARRETLLAPWLLPYEVANGLLVAERSGRVDAARCALAIEAFAGCPWSLEGQGSLQWVMAAREIAANHGLSTYYAAYLELALRQACPLLTLDSQLARAANTAGVAVASRR